jgi:hypothetical protein
VGRYTQALWPSYGFFRGVMHEFGKSLTLFSVESCIPSHYREDKEGFY